MATTTNYGWTTPDDTSLVKDGASAIRTLGSSADTTTKNLNPSTTLGDIEYRSSTANTNTRLGIGSTGNVLTVAAGVPSWAAPATGGTSWTLLNSGGTALTGATTVTVSGISAKNQLMVIVNGASSVTNGIFVSLRFNTDTGNNYYWVGNVLNIGSTYAATNFNGDLSYPGSDIRIGRMSGNDLSKVYAYALVDGCNTTGIKTFQVTGGADAFSNSAQVLYNSGGYYSSASTISSVSVVSSSGNLDAGTVYVYTSA